MSKFYASVFILENLDDIPTVRATHTGNKEMLSRIRVSERDVARCNEKQKVNKTPSPDKISPHILKEEKSKLVKPQWGKYMMGGILDKLVRNRLVNHLEENNLPRDTQPGFWNKWHSHITNLKDLLDDIFN